MHYSEIWISYEEKLLFFILVESKQTLTELQKKTEQNLKLLQDEMEKAQNDTRKAVEHANQISQEVKIALIFNIFLQYFQL